MERAECAEMKRNIASENVRGKYVLVLSCYLIYRHFVVGNFKKFSIGMLTAIEISKCDYVFRIPAECIDVNSVSADNTHVQNVM